MTPQSVYFGYVHSYGHTLKSLDSWRSLDPNEIGNSFPWGWKTLDTGFLKNGNRQDVYDGKVFWTLSTKWYAFFWWDRSGDSRPNSNSGLFLYDENPQVAGVPEAWETLKLQWSTVIQRQKVPLVLQYEPLTSKTS